MKWAWRDLQAFVDPSWLNASSNDDRADTGVSGYASSTKLRTLACRTANDRAVQDAAREAHFRRCAQQIRRRPTGSFAWRFEYECFINTERLPNMVSSDTHTTIRSMSISASPGWIMQVPRTDEWLRLSTSFSFALLGTESL